MKPQERIVEFLCRCFRAKDVRRFSSVFSPLTAEYALYAEEQLILPANVRNTSGSVALPAKTVSSSNTCISASNGRERSEILTAIDRGSGKAALRKVRHAGLCFASGDGVSVAAYRKAVAK